MGMRGVTFEKEAGVGCELGFYLTCGGKAGALGVLPICLFDCGRPLRADFEFWNKRSSLHSKNRGIQFLLNTTAPC